MNSAKLEHFKNLLLDKRKTAKDNRDRLWETIRQSYEAEDEISRHPNNIGDNDASSDDHEYNFKFLEREDKYIQRLDEALEMIKGGTYGICRVCGKEINEERLEAVPTTNICVRCKNSFSSGGRGADD
jgi:DnaK suppressor protein